MKNSLGKTTCFALTTAIAFVAQSQGSLIITGVFDGPLSGGLPKGIELYATTAIPDLSIYGVSSANNGGGATGTPEFTLSGSATVGEFIYLASESSQFQAFLGFLPNFTDNAANINGDDAIELFKNGAVIDIFGEVDVDGNGEDWEYLDGWASRNSETEVDGSIFELANWSFSGPNALDGESNNADATTPIPVGTYTSAPVPEPTTALLGSLALFGLLRRRR
ncbi:MAG: hypothetical protein ACJAVK_002906 [Akkermansiaceae bacterium]|jgi:hypothetical protein